jgi:PHD/YefM family antitoxin component YafN of YafNO toxin-antitoxin module
MADRIGTNSAGSDHAPSARSLKKVETFLQWWRGVIATGSERTVTMIMSSRQFNQDTGAAKKAANREPVVITTRGQPSHVLMTMDEYERLKGNRNEGREFRSLADALGDKSLEADFEFDIPEFKGLFKGDEFG